MAHITRLIAVFAASAAAMIWSATAAVARPLSPPATAGHQAVPTTTIVTHTTSGLAVWTVVLIAVACVALGVLLAQAVRSMRGRSSAHLASA